jgi:hypothetical protein
LGGVGADRLRRAARIEVVHRVGAGCGTIDSALRSLSPDRVGSGRLMSGGHSHRGHCSCGKRKRLAMDGNQPELGYLHGSR